MQPRESLIWGPPENRGTKQCGTQCTMPKPLCVSSGRMQSASASTLPTSLFGSLGPWNSVGRGLLLGVSETGGTFEGVLIYHICRGDDRVPDFLKRS